MKQVLWASAVALLCGWPVAAGAQDVEKKMEELRKRFEKQRKEMRERFEHQMKKLAREFEEHARELRKRVEKRHKDRGGKRGGDELERLRERVEELEKHVMHLRKKLEQFGKHGREEFRKRVEPWGKDLKKKFEERFRGRGAEKDWKEFHKRFEKGRKEFHKWIPDRGEHRNYFERFRKLIEERDWEKLKDLLESFRDRLEEMPRRRRDKEEKKDRKEKKDFKFRFFRKDRDDDVREKKLFLLKVPGDGEKRLFLLGKERPECPFFGECPLSKKKGDLRFRIRKVLPSKEGEQVPSTPY